MRRALRVTRPHTQSIAISARRLKHMPLLSFLLMSVLPLWLAGCLGAPDPLPPRPVADAGPDAFGQVGVPIILDGSGSSPGVSATSTPSTAPLAYHWAFADVPEGSLLLDDAFAPNHDGLAVDSQFVPDMPGLYVVQLLVQEGDVWSIGDFTTFVVDGSPEKPIAEAGPDQLVEQGMAVYLDGSSSHHPDGAQLYYRWTLAGTPSLSQLTQDSVINGYTPFPSLVVDTGGVYTLALVVSDGVNVSDPDYVFITAESLNAIPVARAGADHSIQACTDALVDGSASYDVNGDALSYAWEVLLSPIDSDVSTSSLGGADAAQATLSADKLGNYVLQLTVSDGASSSVPDVINLTAVPRSFNTPPVAVAGDTIELTNKVTCSTTGNYCPDCPALIVPLDGSASTDADNDRLSYLWAASSASEGQLVFTNSHAAQASVEVHGAHTTVGATTTTTYEVELTVTDCPGASNTTRLEIRYQCTGGT